MAIPSLSDYTVPAPMGMNLWQRPVWFKKANDEQFIVACPNALHHHNSKYFNAGDGYEQLTDGTDDLGFISAVIGAVS